MKTNETVSFNAGDNPKFKESVAGKSLGIPTAKEYLKSIGLSEVISEQDLIEFTKLHVKAALEAASKVNIKHDYYHEDDTPKAKLRELSSLPGATERTDGDGILYAVDIFSQNKEAILSAYPESNIK